MTRAKAVWLTTLVALGACRSRAVDGQEQLSTLTPCGPELCDVRKTYCEIYLSDVANPPTDYACRPLPASCLPNASLAGNCSCFPADTPCLSFCGPIGKGPARGFHLTCQGRKRPAR